MPIRVDVFRIKVRRIVVQVVSDIASVFFRPVPATSLPPTADVSGRAAGLRGRRYEIALC